LGSDRVSVVVQHELGIDELPVIADEPVDAVAAAALLVRRERKNDVATRAKTLVLHPQQRRRHDGIAILHILRAAAVEVAVLLDELKGSVLQSSRRASTTSRWPISSTGLC